MVIYGERAGTDLSERWFVLKDMRMLIQACIVQAADEMLHEQTSKEQFLFVFICLKQPRLLCTDFTMSSIYIS